MDWTKNHSRAEIEKQQQEYIREALEMAKKSTVKEPEPAVKEKRLTVEKSVKTEMPVNNIKDEIKDAGVKAEETVVAEVNVAEAAVEASVEIKPDELTKFMPDDEKSNNDEIITEEVPNKEKSETFEIKSDLERLIEKISEERRHDDERKPQCNCPACQKKRMMK